MSSYRQDIGDGLLTGMKVTGRTTWGLTDTIVLEGPAAADEEGNPVGPDKVEIKISSPTRMDLGDWFKDDAEYSLEFGTNEGLNLTLRGVVIPHMEVEEKTRWGLSVTSRLRSDVGRGKYVEVKVSLPWPEEGGQSGFLDEGQIYAVAIEPVGMGRPEDVEPEKPESEAFGDEAIKKLLLRPRRYVSLTVIEELTRLWDATSSRRFFDADDE